ncbi:MAG: ABC transporter permease, partial [Deltaproteobacteria bacterium]
VKKEFISKYRQTLLGPLWYILQPLLMSGVLTLVFGKLSGLSTDGVPQLLFYFSGLVTWGYFTVAFSQTADILISNSHMFKKVYFPRMVMPLSVVISKMLVYGTQFIIFVVLLLYFKIFTEDSVSIHPDLLKILFLTPVYLLVTALLSLGVGLMFAAVTVKYKDFTHVLGFFVQLWFYATPIVYPVSKIPSRYHYVILINPLIPVVDGFRAAFLGTPALEVNYLFGAILTSILSVFLGVLLFNSVERNFVDVI